MINAILFQRKIASQKFNVMDDKLVREQLRSNLIKWVTKLRCNDDVTEKLRFKMKFVEELKSMPIAINTKDANKQHYEVGMHERTRNSLHETETSKYFSLFG